jgi:hypothetical protein
MSRPIALAAIKLTTRSNFAACSTGISAGLVPPRDFVEILSDASVQSRVVWAIGHQATRLEVFSRDVDRRKPRTYGHRIGALDVCEYERIGNDVKGIGHARERFKGRRDVLRSLLGRGLKSSLTPIQVAVLLSQCRQVPKGW